MAEPTNENRGFTSPPVTCYAYAIVLLETLSVKKFQNHEDLKNALDAIGDRQRIILKWHEGAKQWVMPEEYA